LSSASAISRVAGGVDPGDLAEQCLAFVPVTEQCGSYFQSLLFGGELVFKRRRLRTLSLHG
jgi:hypothetical protein